MKVTQFFGPYGVALAVLFLFSNAHCVMSNNSVEGVLTNTIEMEMIELAEESRKSTEEFEASVAGIKQETKQDINDVALLDCNASDEKCLSARTKELLRVETKFKESIVRLKSSREKILTKYKNEVDRKIREFEDIRGAVEDESSVQSQDIDSLEEQEEDMYAFLSEADDYLDLLNESVHTEADCDIDGLSDGMLESEWETLMGTFKAIVNLGYVFFEKDHIFLDDEVEYLPNSRNLYLRRRLLRRSYDCLSCNDRPLTAVDGAMDMDMDMDMDAGVSPFNKFVNDYLAAFITSMYTTHLENDTPLNVNCTFY
eukprot:CAMPEP_0198292500 /NCGR_PEP_ID=MMETSP1449-20131203/12332_1 /TAXON_ID=420275 /ORGANISM="Attheya septentrionalis, Strain CCMP2084" /LENGTH=312 /DNA_ID=CAMNT_0043991589 /DNA_START=66 /DNA_END=1004 /DNA_ORIENTATION=-